MNLSSIIESKRFSNNAQKVYLLYYCMLAVYAVCNLYTLFIGILPISHAGGIILATLCMMCAIVNEVINMKTITNPKPETTQKNGKAGDNWIYWAIAACVIWAFALIEVYASVINMTTIQIDTLAKLNIALTPLTITLYQNLFLMSGLGAQAMTMAKNLYTYLKITIGTAQNNTKSLPADKNLQEKSGKISSNSLDQKLAWYLNNTYTSSIGVSIGGFLYAYGDYAQLFGLLSMMQNTYLLGLHPASIGLTASSFAISTFCERILIWGYNFRRFEQEHTEYFHEGQTKKKHSNHRPLFHLIPTNVSLRKYLTNFRTLVIGLRSILVSALLFSGWRKYFGVCASIGYFATNYVQSSFQTQESPVNKEKARSEPTSDGVNQYRPMA